MLKECSETVSTSIPERLCRVSPESLSKLPVNPDLSSQITVQRDSGLDVTAPKHGKVDPKNAPHVGGNQWAGGTGASGSPRSLVGRRHGHLQFGWTLSQAKHRQPVTSLLDNHVVPPLPCRGPRHGRVGGPRGALPSGRRPQGAPGVPGRERRRP